MKVSIFCNIIRWGKVFMIILIRHAKVLFNWKKKYTADGFFAAQAAYDQAPIERITDVQIRHIKDVLPKEFKLYTSTLKRSIETAAMIFPDKTPIQLPELSEIPIYPYRNSDKEIALRRWLFWGRVQWFCNNPRRKLVPPRRSLYSCLSGILLACRRPQLYRLAACVQCEYGKKSGR